MEIRHLTHEYIDSLVELGNKNKEEFKHFTPHAFSREAIADIIDCSKLDLYYVVLYESKVIGYGMLRGMDEGYNVPSLGIGVDKAAYGTGVAKTLMEFLEAASRLRGYKKMRLRVYKENPRAFHFYTKLGYTYEPYDDESVLGFKEL
uniref:Putative acetyltransferase n=1 Tax=viral metagenome TaxID=1070528 RepID=A0A6M3IV24_9ZZZZ